MHHKLCLWKAFDVSRFWNIYHNTLQNIRLVWCKMLLLNDMSNLLTLMVTWDNSFQYQNIRVIAHKNKREDFRQLGLFLFVWTTCFDRSCRLQRLFCTDIELTEQEFSSVDRNVYKIFVTEFILAFQLQFGTYEAESEHFRWEKEKRHSNE